VTVVRIVDTADEAGGRPLPRAIVTDRRFPMVGRTDDLAATRRRWADVEHGSLAAVLVSGPPGLGKSRFVAQVAADAHAAGATVLAGVCETDVAVPYQPFAMAFADAAAGDDELSAAATDGAGPLGPLFPSRRSARADDPGPSARFELFEAVNDLVDRLAHDQPLVLVMEDVHWAEPSTVSLLRHLVRHASAARVLIVASYRAEEIGPGHPLQDLLADLSDAASTTAVTRVELLGLQESEVGELITARAPDAPADGVAALARRIHTDSGGSPFFVCELLHHLSSTGELPGLVAGGVAVDALPIPDSVRDVVGSRLGRLPDTTRDLLAMAATIGLAFDLDLLARAVDRDPGRTLEDLEEVARVALVHEVGPGRFTFSHAIVRATLVDQQSATRAALAHRRVAEAIIALDRPEFDELARHWRLAGDEEQAIANLELAARRDLEALAFESAIDRYETVLDHQRAQPAPDLATIGRASLGVGLGRRALGQPDYLPSVEEAGRIGRKLRDADLVIDAAIASTWPGNFFLIAGQTEAGLVELNEDALAMIPTDDVRRIRVLLTLATHLSFDDDRGRRAALLGEALTLATEVGDPELIGSAKAAEFLVLWDPSTLNRRAELSREVGRMARATYDVDLEFFAGFFAALVAAERCDLDRARRHLADLAPTVAASQNFYFGFLVDRFGVALDVFTGRHDVQRQIDDLAQRYDGTHADTSGTWALQTGAMAFQGGGLAQLVPMLEGVVRAHPSRPNWVPPLGVALLEAGDREGATAVLDGFEEPPLDYFWLTTMQAVAELAVGLGRADRARAVFDQLLPFRDQLGITSSGTFCFGLVATSLGMLASSLGDHAAAVSLLEGAVAQADAMGAPFESVRARRHLASALGSAGAPPNEVAAVVADALAIAEPHPFDGEKLRLIALAPIGTAD
jgi:tetratricopeptide (TPR) repeat protein